MIVLALKKLLARLSKAQLFGAVLCGCLLTTALVAAATWASLHVALTQRTGYSKVNMQLPDQLLTSTQIHGGQVSHMKGYASTQIPLHTNVRTGLYGNYPVHLAFRTQIPLHIRVDYDTLIEIDQTISIESTTDLIYEDKLLPELPIRMKLPVKLRVPFGIHETYKVVADVTHDDKASYTFNESFSVPVDQMLNVRMPIDDTLRIVSIDRLPTLLHDIDPNIETAMNMKVVVPLSNLERNAAAD